MPAVPPGSLQIPADFLNAIGRAIDQARVVPGNALAHNETPGGTYLEPTENGQEFRHPFYIQYLGDKPGNSNKGLITIAEGRVLGRADGERGAWEFTATEGSRPGNEYQTSLGIYGIWAEVPASLLPADDRLTDDLSIIKPGEGSGIELSDSIVNNPYLVSSNAPSYEIDLGTGGEWYMIAIKATGTDSDETPKGWEFELVNLPLTEVLKYYDKEQGEYDPPRIVDNVQLTVRGDTDNMPQTINTDLGEIPNHPAQLDGFEERVLPVEQITGPVIEDPSTNEVRPLVLRYQYRYSLHRIVEIGTYFLPIAYHRSTGSGWEMQQVARSDFHFWPVPRIHTWSKWAEPTELIWGDTVLPP